MTLKGAKTTASKLLENWIGSPIFVVKTLQDTLTILEVKIFWAMHLIRF